MARLLRTAGLALCLLWAAWPAGAAEKPLRFAFHKGDTLTYHVKLSAGGTGKEGAYAGTSEGTVTLKVHQLQPDGTAMIRVSTTGAGSIKMGSESIDLTQEPTPDIIALVKPDGSIAALRDTAGKKASLLQQDGFNILSAPVAIRSYAIGSYALFGLILGSRPGAKWTGSLKHETGHGGTLDENFDPSKMAVTLSSTPVTYTLGAATECNGRPCVEIKATSVIYPDKDNPGGFPGTFCFDPGSGRLLSLKAHAKAPSGAGGVDYTVELVEGK